MSILDNETIIVDDQYFIEQKIKYWLEKNTAIMVNNPYATESFICSVKDMPKFTIKDGVVEIIIKQFQVRNNVEFIIKDDFSIPTDLFRFGQIDCSVRIVSGNNKYGLNTLKGMPIRVNGNFICQSVLDLKNLQGLPKYVEGDVDISTCKILETADIKYMPEFIGGNLYIHAITVDQEVATALNDSIRIRGYVCNAHTGHTRHSFILQDVWNE